MDRHYLKTPEKTALIWEKDEPGQHQHVTYKYVCLQFAVLYCLKQISLKRKIDKLQCSKVRYMVSYRDCSVNYIGKTKRKLVTRVCKHRAALKGKGFSCIAEHVFATGHVVDWDIASIIGTAKTDLQLVYKETFLIKEFKLTLNSNSISINVNVFN